MLPLLLLATPLLPHLDLGVYALGLVTGAGYALSAVAVVLVHRCCRVVDVSQLAVGAPGAVVLAALTTYDPLLRVVRAGCPTCLDPVPGWWPPLVLVLGLVACVALPAALGWAFGRVVVARLAAGGGPAGAGPGAAGSGAAGTVATLFAVGAYGWAAAALAGAGFWQSQQQRDAQVPLQVPRLPFEWRLPLGLVTLHAPELLVPLVVLPLALALAWFLARSTTGLQVRALAARPARAASLGVDVRRVTARVWLVAGALAGTAAALGALGGALPRPGSPLDPSLLVRVLVVVACARFASLRGAVLSALALGVLQQCVSFALGSSALLDGGLLAVVVAVLLLQRRGRVRADAAGGAAPAAREPRVVPSVLARLPEVRRRRRSLALAVAVVLLVVPVVLPPRELSLVTGAGAVSVVLLSLVVLTGWAGQLSFGQLAFAAAGAWVAASSGLPFPLALVAAAAGGALLSTAAGLPALRVPGLPFAVVTLALDLCVSTYLLGADGLGGVLPPSLGRPVVLGLRLDDERAFLVVVALVALLVAAGLAALRRSAFARALIAARDNAPAAQALAVRVVRVRLGAFAVSGGIAGLGGALVAYAQHGVHADAFGLAAGLQVTALAVLGGLGSAGGPLLAGAALALASVALSGTTGPLVTSLAGLALLVGTDGGAVGALAGVRDQWLRGVALRRGIAAPGLLPAAQVAQEARRLPIRPPSARGAVGVPVRYRVEAGHGLLPPAAEPLEASR